MGCTSVLYSHALPTMHGAARPSYSLMHCHPCMGLHVRPILSCTATDAWVHGAARPTYTLMHHQSSHCKSVARCDKWRFIGGLLCLYYQGRNEQNYHTRIHIPEYKPRQESTHVLSCVFVHINQYLMVRCLLIKMQPIFACHMKQNFSCCIYRPFQRKLNRTAIAPVGLLPL